MFATSETIQSETLQFFKFFCNPIQYLSALKEREVLRCSLDIQNDTLVINITQQVHATYISQLHF